MRIIGALAISFLMLIVGCTETTTIGTEVLNQDQASVLNIDTFTVETATTIENPVEVYNTNTFPNFFIGDLEDPIWGRTTSSFYTQFRINQNSLPNFPTDAVFDSLVLRLAYDRADVYGDTTAAQEFEVYRITDANIPFDSVYNADQTFNTGELLGSATFVPNFQDSIDIKIGEDTVTFPPHLSIRLSDDLGTELINYTSTQNENNDNFLADFGGLLIKPVGGGKPGIVSFNAFSLSTGLNLYYHTEEEPESQLYYEYDVTTLSIRVPNMEADFSTLITNAVDGSYESGKNLLYLGGMVSPNISIKLPTVKNFKGEALINNAEISFTIQEQSDEDLYPPVEQIILLYKNADGGMTIIDDVAFTFNGTSEALFGGQIEEYTAADGTSQRRYKMNISGHLQKMVDEDAGIPDELIMRVYLKTEKANRVVLYGSEHPDYPAKLNVNFTKLN